MSVGEFLNSIYTGNYLELAFFLKDANLKLGNQFATSVMCAKGKYNENEFNKVVKKYNKKNSSSLDFSLDDILKSKVFKTGVEDEVILIQIS